MDLRIILVLSVELVMIVTSEELPRGYLVNKADGRAYKLVYQAKPWQEARDLCVEEGAKLAVPKSKEEFEYIQKLMRGMYYPGIRDSSGYKLMAWLGVSNLHNYTVWRNVDDENIEVTGFHVWAGENGQGFSDDPREPHCAGLDAINYGYRDWWCHHHQPYFCQIDTNSIYVAP